MSEFRLGNRCLRRRHAPRAYNHSIVSCSPCRPGATLIANFVRSCSRLYLGRGRRLCKNPEEGSSFLYREYPQITPLDRIQTLLRGQPLYFSKYRETCSLRAPHHDAGPNRRRFCYTNNAKRGGALCRHNCFLVLVVVIFAALQRLSPQDKKRDKRSER